MMLLVALLLVATVGLTQGEVGYSDPNNEDWGYEWYTGEEFHFYCNGSNEVVVTAADYVTWMTPSKKILQNGFDDDVYKVSPYSGIAGYELTLKNVQSGVHGVYVCEIYNNSTATKRAQATFGMNVRDVKYHDMIDKYRYNIVVAFIAMAVFVVPFGTVCFVFHFQYLTPEQKEKKANKMKAHRNYTEQGVDMELPKKFSPTDDGAYENPDFSTQL